ncbi:hypothetical protein [Pseudomonas putida]|uniref:Uncharacterized protein n=1 Tax=Pseudomonas putida TaxID=303 RepID=A0A8I1EC82_PSEPU|nr:hypothetical protein [Pseudomonas putida]MBI6882692.1 hypothetical protein [Pseudomonas putida]
MKAEKPVTLTSRQLDIASTWADLFCKESPEMRDLFCSHFIARTSIKRFWKASCDVEGSRISVCRLGDNLMLAYYGGRINRLPLKEDKFFGLSVPAEITGPTESMASFLRYVAYKLESPKVKEARDFDALTSYSQHAYNLANRTLNADIPKQLSIWAGPKCRYAGYHSVRQKKYLGHLGFALKDFLSEVDQDKLRAVRSVRCPSITLYNWLSEGATERRMQALKACPVLVPMEVLLHESRKSQKIADITYLIDHGESFTPLLAKLHKTNESVIKKLYHLSPYLIGSALYHLRYRFDREEFKQVIRAFMLGNKRPKTRKGWKICLEIVEMTGFDLSESSLAGMPEWESKEWTEINKDIRRIYSTRGFGDTIAANSVKSAINLSAQWHSRKDQIQKIHYSKIKYTGCKWISVFNSSISHDDTGITFAEIVDDAVLHKLGESLNYCIGNLVSNCYDGKSIAMEIKHNESTIGLLEIFIKTKSGSNFYSCRPVAINDIDQKTIKSLNKACSWLSRSVKKIIGNRETHYIDRLMRSFDSYSIDDNIMAEMRDWSINKLIELGFSKKASADQDLAHHDT